MAAVKVKISMNTGNILMLQKAQQKAAKLTAEALKNDIERSGVVPRDVGTLEESVSIKPGALDRGALKLIYNTPYARRLYFHPEYHFHQEPWEETVHHKDGTVSRLKHDGNRNAKGKWLEDYISGSKKNYVRDTYKRFYKMLKGR